MAKQMVKQTASAVDAVISPERWGKDHWSLLGYVVTRFDEELQRQVLRCNENRHPLLRSGGLGRHTLPWEDKWSTRLRDSADRVPGHDDYDCLDDLEAAGLVEIISLVNGFVWLTEKGNAVGFRLREHKMRGGTFATFIAPSKLMQGE
jgi:hypothetical protein